MSPPPPELELVLTPLDRVKPVTLKVPAEILNTRLESFPLIVNTLAPGPWMVKFLAMASPPLVSVIVPETEFVKRTVSPLPAARMVCLNDPAPESLLLRTISVEARAGPAINAAQPRIAIISGEVNFIILVDVGESCLRQQNQGSAVGQRTRNNQASHFHGMHLYAITQALSLFWLKKMVRARGLEPPILSEPDPKSGASAI